METEMIDKLFLELSQITKAKTEKELQLERLLEVVLKAWEEDGVKNQNGHVQLYNSAFARIAKIS